MGKSITKVVYKPDPNASDVFLVIVNPLEVRFIAKANERYRLYYSSIRNGRTEVIYSRTQCSLSLLRTCAFRQVGILSYHSLLA